MLLFPLILTVILLALWTQTAVIIALATSASKRAKSGESDHIGFRLILRFCYLVLRLAQTSAYLNC